MAQSQKTLKSTSLRTCASGKLAALVILALSAACGSYAQDALYQLSYTAPNWSWANMKLPGPGASQFSGVAAFNTTPNNQLHVFYQDVSNNIHQLYFNGTVWSDENLTSTTKGVTARPSQSGISGFSIGNFQYVYFLGTDGHVHEYSYVNSWVDTDVTKKTGGATAQALNRLVAFATGSQRHVYFVATNATIHQLYWNGTQWFDQNLTNITEGATAEGPDIAGCAINNHQYIFFASGGHLHMYSYINSWTDTDWTDRSGISAIEGVTGFAIPGTTRLQMYFDTWGPSGSLVADLIQLSYDETNPGEGTFSNLPEASGTPGFNMVGFATTPNDQLHLFYSDNGIGQLYFNGTSWTTENLPSTNSSFTGVDGFSIGNGQYVYYVDVPPVITE